MQDEAAVYGTGLSLPRWELLDCDIADFKFTVSLYDTSRKHKPSGAK